MVFEDEMLLKNHVRQVNGVDLEPGNGSWPTIRHSKQDTRYGSSAHLKKISQTTRSELGPRWRQYVKEQGDTSLRNVNKVEKGHSVTR